jgi:hypothetical protein
MDATEKMQGALEQQQSEHKSKERLGQHGRGDGERGETGELSTQKLEDAYLYTYMKRPMGRCSAHSFRRRFEIEIKERVV